jgi:phosphate/sulfate permease
VAYALVELLPAEVLSPPSGAPAVSMLVALFISALFWNIGTWWFGLPNSSSHCLIGALVGVALGNALVRDRSPVEGVHWAKLWTVSEALALSPVLGFILSGAAYFGLSRTVRDKHLYVPAGECPPVWWMRGVLILTCTGVSFAHGTNDGQKSIGLIMLTIIGLFPAVFALNPMAAQSLADLPKIVRQTEPLIEKYGVDQKEEALKAAKGLEGYKAEPPAPLRLSRSLSSTKVKAASPTTPAPTLRRGLPVYGKVRWALVAPAVDWPSMNRCISHRPGGAPVAWRRCIVNVPPRQSGRSSRTRRPDCRSARSAESTWHMRAPSPHRARLPDRC